MEVYKLFVKEIQKIPARMGSITIPQQQFLTMFLQEHPEIKEVLETGFHMGLSAATMMSIREDIQVTSFDIFWFDYTRRAKLLLDLHYPLRNMLVAGNSVCSLQTFFTKFPFYMPDLVFVDGGHERPVPFLDMYFILNHIREGTWIIIDDYCEEHGSGGVNEAVDEFINQGYMEQIQAYKAGDRGWVVGKRSARAMAHYEQTSKEELMKVYRDIESHYPQ
jgi:predicted O-methyltransferase YrrM